MFVDASALLAMLLDEAEARLLAARLQRAGTRLTSPLAVMETILGLRRALGLGAEASEAAVAAFLELMGIRVMSMPGSLAAPGAVALARFGDALGACECLAYAAARYYRLPLLHRNPAFALTDIEPA